MGLTLETVASTTATATPDKQIAVRGTGTPGVTVLYTVPTGRKFKGHITFNQATDTGVTTVAYINNKHVQYMVKSGPFPVELVAGTVVTCGSASYSTGVFGVESDA